MFGQVLLRLREGRRGCELADREGGDRFGLVRRPHGFVLLHPVEVVVIVEVDADRGEDRADRDRGDGGDADPKARPHAGTAASDSQR